METKSKAIQKQIDDAKTAIAKKQKKLAEAIQKEKAEKYDLFKKLFSDEETDGKKGKYHDSKINGENAFDFINRKIDEELEAIAAEEAAKKEAAKAAKEQKADADSSDDKSKKDVAKDESSSTSKTDKQAVKEQAASGKQVEVNRTPKRIDPTTGRPIY